MYYCDKRIEGLVRVFDQNNRADYLRLDLNENPGGLPEEFVERILSGITPQMIAQYPETQGFTTALADFLGTDAAHLCLVNGSAEGIRYIIQAFTSENGKIVGVTPSYFMFQVYSELYGRNLVQVPYRKDLTIHVSDIIAELTGDTQLLILLNPNNPMGNAYSTEEFEAILASARKHQITVLIDEAYYYFYPETFIKYALHEDHIFVTRTFSKLFSMAGCRLGYVAGWPEGIRMIQKLCTPHNTNMLAMRMAQAVIETPGMIDSLIADYLDGRNYLTAALDAHGYAHKGDAGNFLFIKPKTNANGIVRRMKADKKILIKMYPGIGELGDCLRVSIGGKQYMQRFVQALLELDK